VPGVPISPASKLAGSHLVNEVGGGVETTVGVLLELLLAALFDPSSFHHVRVVVTNKD